MPGASVPFKGPGAGRANACLRVSWGQWGLSRVRAEAGRWKVWSHRVEVCAAPLGRGPWLLARSRLSQSGEAAAVQAVVMGPGRGSWPWVGSSQQEEAGFWRQNPARCGPDLALVGGCRRWRLGGPGCVVQRSPEVSAGAATGRHRALLGFLGLEQGPANFCCHW